MSGVVTVHACAGCVGGASCRVALCGHDARGVMRPQIVETPHGVQYAHVREHPKELARERAPHEVLCARCVVLADAALQVADDQ